jgi:hypothetical protein
MSLHAFMRRRRSLAAIALLAFAVRALIPVGYMPSGNGFFGLQICPEGLSAQALALIDPHAAHHHHLGAGGTAGAHPHDHQSWASGHCAFAALAAAAPSPHPVSIELTLAAASVSNLTEPVRVAERHRYRSSQPRGPPSLA